MDSARMNPSGLSPRNHKPVFLNAFLGLPWRIAKQEIMVLAISFGYLVLAISFGYRMIMGGILLDAGMDWIIHLDTDELIHPAGAREYSLRRLLLDVPDNVDMVIFPNYESNIKRDDIKGPFTELCFNVEKLRSSPKGYILWPIQRSNTCEIKLEEAAILHYTYRKFSDLTLRRDRCDCKPTKEDVKRCFILEFDPLAIIRGLKESGVFTSAVTSAKAQSKTKSSNMGLEKTKSPSCAM